VKSGLQIVSQADNSRRFTSDALIIASNNVNKIKEIQGYFADLKLDSLKLYQPKDFALGSPEETEVTFEGNSELKARYYGDKSGLVAIADDTGICVDALDGNPGVNTANWAVNGDFKPAMLRVQKELVEVGCKDQFPKAVAVCVISIYWPDDQFLLSFEGRMQGKLDFSYIDKPTGHGFQPIFIPDGFTIPYGQLTREQLKSVGHRYKAMQKLINACFS
jgi:XTP/dITP diphosphohydrolase